MNISMLNPGIERQVGTSLEDIRDDHKERYIWASKRLTKTETVLDAGCGVGYGSFLLAERTGFVKAVDVSSDSIRYAQRYWAKPNISHAVEDLCYLKADKSKYDAVIAFEVVEHLIEPRLFLLSAFDCLKVGGRLFISVPNEKVIPHTVNLNPFHLRHYTSEEIKVMLFECGFEVTTLASQNAKEIVEGDTGRFLILETVRCAKRPVSLDHADLTQHSLTEAAAFIVARAMAIHKATKDARALKVKLDEASKALASGEARSEPQLKLLQFLEGLQAQSNTSRELLVSDMMRRLKEVETFERDLRERLTQAELQHARAEEAVKHAELRWLDQTAVVKKLSIDLASSRDEVERYRRVNERQDAELERANGQRAVMSSQIEQIARDRELAIQTASDERMALESEIVALNHENVGLHQKLSEIEQRSTRLQEELLTIEGRFEKEREEITVQLDAAKKQASSVEARSNSMAVRLLAFGRDHQLVMEANAELVQKLETSETEISRLARTTEALRSELQSNSSTSIKPPPTLGNIYKKLRFHRFYVPFLYKAVRNSVRNQSKRFRAKA